MARQGDNFYLVIQDTVADDSGVFMANAANNEGQAKSYSRLSVTKQTTSSSSSTANDGTVRQLNIENLTSPGGTRLSGQPPEFKKLFYDKHVKIGESLRIDTVIMGSPKPKVTLIKKHPQKFSQIFTNLT